MFQESNFLMNYQFLQFVQNSSMKENRKSGKKIISPQEFLSLIKRNEKNRQWILKQLEQLQVDTKLLEGCPLHELYSKCEEIFKSTYSVKYLGMNKHDMGVISRRLDPFKQTNFSLNGLPQFSYIINKYFYPKPLKVGNKQKKPEAINTKNLQSQIISAFSSQNQSKINKRDIQFQNIKKNRGSFVSGSWKKMDLNLNKRRKSETFYNNIKSKQKLDINPMNGTSDNFRVNQKASLPANSYSRFLSQGRLFVRDRK